MEFQLNNAEFTSLQDKVNELLVSQIKDWELAAKNYQGIIHTQRKQVKIKNGADVVIQFNPERIYSSSAKVDDKSISERPCFLCSSHLPKQQQWVTYGKDYIVLVNPFPIFPRHLTIPHRSHTKQRIKRYFPDMLQLTRELDEYTVFYNGPRCGASAPDHFHFQAGNKGFMPVEHQFESHAKTLIQEEQIYKIWSMNDYLRYCIVLEGSDAHAINQWFQKIFESLQTINSSDDEPMMNLLASWHTNQWRVFIFPRKLHRPRQFFDKGDDQILLSPASVDMGGVLIIPRKEDQVKLNKNNITDIYQQVTLDKTDFDKLILALVQ